MQEFRKTRFWQRKLEFKFVAPKFWKCKNLEFGFQKNAKNSYVKLLSLIRGVIESIKSGFC